MGLRRFQPSRRASGAFEVRQETPEATATFRIGAPLQRDTNTEFVEEHAGGATVTGILGVAMTAVTTGTPAFGSTIPVAIASLEQEFLGTFSDGSAVSTPTEENEGVSYGMVKIANEWYIDTSDTTHIVLRITKVYPDLQAGLFKFLAAAIVS